MADAFDPYYKWLGIPPHEQPPNHYRLLAINLFESDSDVIEAAADRQMSHLRSYQTGKHSAESQRLLNECAAARVALLNPQKKAEYDRQLREKLAPLPRHSGEGGQPRPVPRPQPLPQPQPAAEPAPRIAIDGESSAARLASRRRKTRSAWQLPAAGVGGAIALALLLWIALRPTNSLDQNKQPAETPPKSRISQQPRNKPRSTQPTVTEPDDKQSASVISTTAAAPPVEQKPLLVADASHRPETPGVIGERIVLWNLQREDQGTRELNVSLLRNESEIWRRDSIEIPWSPEISEKAAIEIPPLRFDRVRVEITKWEKTRGGLAEVEVLQGDRNLAHGCPVTGMYWSPQWAVSKLTDGDTTSSHDGFWLLHEYTAGWAEIDLAFAEPRACSGVLADHVKIWNTHNGQHNDRGSLELNLHLFQGRNEVWHKDSVAMPWQADADSHLQVKLPDERFDRLRIEIPRWQGQGGGLAEVQVTRGDVNLAIGCPTTASACLSDAFTPAKLVDDFTTARQAAAGYWLAADNTAGWVEIDLSCNCPEIGKTNRELGQYRALVENDWLHGLPWLARGDLIDLRTLAAADERLWSSWAIGTPQAPAALSVGDRWWDLARESAEPIKEKLLRRALYYYAGARRSLPQSDVDQLDERLIQSLPLPDGTPLYVLHEAEIERVFPNDSIRAAIYVRGVRYHWGFWMHPYSDEIAATTFELSKKYRRLVGGVGIADTSQDAAHSPLTFKILADGRELWKSQPIQRAGTLERFDVDVSGAERLKLEVECPGSNESCHAAWLDPVLDPSPSWPAIDKRESRTSVATAASTDGGANSKQLDLMLAPGVTMRLVKIPASAGGRIKSFYLSQTEVTQKQWVAVMASNPSSPQRDNLPVNMVTLDNAKSFAEKLGAIHRGMLFRLPAADEMTHACLAGESTAAYLADAKGHFWTAENSERALHSVASLQPNAWHLFDLIGNAWEWLDDGRTFGGSVWQPTSDHRNAPATWKLTKPNGVPIEKDALVGFRIAANLRGASGAPMAVKSTSTDAMNAQAEIQSPQPKLNSPVLGKEPLLAVPDGESLKKARLDLQKRISAEVAAAKSPDLKRKLAQELLHKALAAEKRDADVYAALDEAIELAEAAGDLDLAWQGIDGLAGTFAIEALARRQQSLTQITKAAKSPARSYEVTVDACLLLADALAAEDTELVKKVAAQAQSLAKRAKDTTLAKAVASYARDANKLVGQIEAVAQAREELKTMPDEAGANFTVGYYELAAAGDYEHGLPKLAKAADDAWRKPAVDDLEASRNEVAPGRRLAVADVWWARADGESWPARHYLRKRATHWYRQALPSLAGGERTRAIDRIKEFLADDDGLPKWELFQIDGGERLRGCLRLDPDRSLHTCVDYDAPMEITLVARTDSLNIRLLVHGHEIIWNWEADPRKLVVQRPDGAEIQSPTVPLQPHRWYTLRYRIGRQGTLISIDGVPVFTESHTYGKFPKAAIGVGRQGPAVVEVKKLVIKPIE